MRKSINKGGDMTDIDFSLQEIAQFRTDTPGAKRTGGKHA
jgi:hypothetical protein